MDDWPSHGRTALEQRFSPLDQISTGTVGRLKLAWAVELDTARGQEATPIVVDGVMYVATAWSKVLAVDAATGRELWRFDPEVDGSRVVFGCCDIVSRGVAVADGRVYLATFDGRLIALDAATGKPVWSVLTIDLTQPYTITGAPRVFKGKVVIGNAGSELGVRGYVTAYDAASGRKLWRFYTVPGDPSLGPDGEISDQPLQKLARPTWSGEWWRLGGGGTVWDSIVYDEELDQLLIGVGNGSPWNHEVRSGGVGDNLFLSSIVALDPDTGAYRWHFQETPGDTWDFTATQHIMLADLKIDGHDRRVLMHAPKNGFFYVIDRTNGKLISAKNFVNVNWARGVDIVTGRPIEVPAARYRDKPFTVVPSPLGAHSWMPMSFNPDTGLVYIPAMEVPLTMRSDASAPLHKGRWNTFVKFGLATEAEAKAAGVQSPRGMLIAWDPLHQREVWRHDYVWPWNGGTLATGGNLVVQGDGQGTLRAFAADNGQQVWSTEVRRGIIAPPVTYRARGEQYIAVVAGYGGSMGVAVPSPFGRHPVPAGMIVAYKLDGEAALSQAEAPAAADVPRAAGSFSAEQVTRGRELYARFCSVCHDGPVNPDLKNSAITGDPGAWRSVVIDGALLQNGMASFRDYMSAADAEAIRAYAIDSARNP